MSELKIGRKHLRSFGFIVAAGFTIIGLWPLVFRGDGVRTWALGIAIFMFTTGLIYPPVLKPLFRVWMAVGEVLGWVNTRIILALVYYGMIVPIGMLLRLMKNDPMQRSFDRSAASYRITRTKRPASHMQRQY
jgi:hypothetical protein